MMPDADSQPVILPSANRPTVSGVEGNYRVIRLLGRGTMSSVYLAEQVSMARPVALKILSPALSGDRKFVERFMREARASARLNHPNIVSAIDFGEFDDRFFLAMEFVDGRSLSEVLEKDGAIDEHRAVSIGLQVISALKHAAGHGVIHLDVKPANIMIRKDGRVKLADFGLAMILEHPGAAEASRKAVGTPYYMAPEQVEGGTLDWRSDQYSLGASLYEAVTGVKPFQGNSVPDILVKRFFEKPEAACRAGNKRASRGFSAVLAKMLARSPDNRYQSSSELENDFIRCKNGKKPMFASLSLINRPNAPSASAWNSMSDTDVISRIDGLRWRMRWSWIVYASVLFLAALGVYGAMHAKEIAGQSPPARVRHELVDEAAALPDGKAGNARELWLGAMQTVFRAEKEPSAENLRRAVNGFRRLVSDADFEDTAYGASAREAAEYFMERLRKLEEEEAPREGPSAGALDGKG